MGGTLPPHLAVVPATALALGAGLVPTAGAWTRHDDGARFEPRFAPAVGAVFAVVGRQDPAGPWVELARAVAPGTRAAPSVVVESIDPRIDSVPANLLRFAVAFSAPIEEGSAAGRISLQDASGREIPGTLLPMPPELWDRDRRVLTVLLEPGRIKRGLQPNVQAGPPLVEGAVFSVVVSPEVRDADGADLLTGASRRYRVGPPVRARVDPTLWTVEWPGPVSSSLGVHFDRPLDRTLVRRCLRVVDSLGRAVPGAASLDEGGCVWTFAARAEPAGAHGWRVEVDTRLEDLAGNSVRRVFDRDLGVVADESLAASVDVVVLGPAAAGGFTVEARRAGRP